MLSHALYSLGHSETIVLTLRSIVPYVILNFISMKECYVVLGGWLRNVETYKKLVDSAPKENRVYIIPHIYLPSIDKLNENILQKLKEQDINNITLIGHSLGGAFAISFTASHPEYVKKLILVDSEGIPDRRSLLIIFLKWIKDCILFHGIAKAKENVTAVLRLIGDFPYYFRVSRFAISADVREYAQKIKIPTLILWGGKDKVTTIENAKEFNRLIKNSKLVVLPDMDHDWLIHNPQKLWANIEK